MLRLDPDRVFAEMAPKFTNGHGTDPRFWPTSSFSRVRGHRKPDLRRLERGADDRPPFVQLAPTRRGHPGTHRPYASGADAHVGRHATLERQPRRTRPVGLTDPPPPPT